MTCDDQLRQIAERQHALVTLTQARAELSLAQLTLRLAGSDWELMTDRVMRLVGAPRTPEQPIMAAILDAGGPAVASYRCAAGLWRLPGFSLGEVEVSRQRGSSGRRPTVGRFHEHRWLPHHHMTSLRGVAVTTLPRTLFDLAGHLHPARTERIVASVIGKSPGTLRVLHRLLPELAERGRNGIVIMRDILDRNPVGSVQPQSSLERRVNHIVLSAGLTPLVPQVDVGGHEWIGRVDYQDPVVTAVLYEIDSLIHHSSALDQLLDAERDAELYAAGYRRVIRIPEEHVWYEPWKVVEVVESVQRPSQSEAAPRFDSRIPQETRGILLSKQTGRAAGPGRRLTGPRPGRPPR